MEGRSHASLQLCKSEEHKDGLRQPWFFNLRVSKNPKWFSKLTNSLEGETMRKSWRGNFFYMNGIKHYSSCRIQCNKRQADKLIKTCTYLQVAVHDTKTRPTKYFLFSVESKAVTWPTPFCSLTFWKKHFKGNKQSNLLIGTRNFSLQLLALDILRRVSKCYLLTLTLTTYQRYSQRKETLMLWFLLADDYWNLLTWLKVFCCLGLCPSLYTAYKKILTWPLGSPGCGF